MAQEWTLENVRESLGILQTAEHARKAANAEHRARMATLDAEQTAAQESLIGTLPDEVQVRVWDIAAEHEQNMSALRAAERAERARYENTMSETVAAIVPKGTERAVVTVVVAACNAVAALYRRKVRRGEAFGS